MAYLVAAGIEFSVGAVLDIVEVVLGDIGVDFGAGEGQQRTDDGNLEIGNGKLRNGSNAVETGDAGAAEEVEEEGFDGVVAVVGGGDC